ncbi:hypothetical protein N8T08_007217 [Aspergillus melleus]|uniref:Uncharacterized protein n=1 Tax=Aspergillus melleus TaxID=138277 RepID=A0ACC3AYC4_9EURO|nr:hypothetical protein N8T08_007217 [Aspergillus melleus]
MLPSFRHFLRYIGLDQKCVSHGFKHGAAFRLASIKQEGCNYVSAPMSTTINEIDTDAHDLDTDFISAGEPDNYTWNLVRSEADHLLFQHARECGARAVDGIRVDALQFTHADAPGADSHSYCESLGFTRPVSATYTRKSDGRTGSINFQYVVDASGRARMINTKCRKDHQYSKMLKNTAHWTYWSGTEMYAVGTSCENSPYFEALHGLPNRLRVDLRNQKIGNARKVYFPAEGSTRDFYMSSLRQGPNIPDMLSSAKCETSVRSAPDYSYSSAIPYARVVGDAGCFIDPFFSSGVHLALTALRGDCDEETAAAWHSTKVADVNMRFPLVVLSAYRQMSLAVFNPASFNTTQPEHKARMRNQDATDSATVEEAAALKHLQACKLLRTETSMGLDDFGGDVIVGYRPHLQPGELGLRMPYIQDLRAAFSLARDFRANSSPDNM